MSEVVSGASAASLLPAAGECVAQPGEAVGRQGDPVAVAKGSIAAAKVRGIGGNP